MYTSTLRLVSQPRTICMRLKNSERRLRNMSSPCSILSLNLIGPIKFKTKMEQGDDMFRQRRSLFFKKMQIVRGCDTKRNVLVYMVYSDRIIEGSPKNSTSTVPIMPWGAADANVQKCAEFFTQ